MTAPNRPALLLAYCLPVVLFLLSACGSVRDQFVGVRIEDACNGEWPICATTVGCFIGDRSYVTGRFPGKNKIALQIFEPSTVTASFFVSEVSGAGDLTVVTFYEDKCRARIRTEITGRTFLGEAEKRGFVSRDADLTGVGDHLIEFESDARARYLMKIDVMPLRLKDNPGGG